MHIQFMYCSNAYSNQYHVNCTLSSPWRSEDVKGMQLGLASRVRCITTGVEDWVYLQPGIEMGIRLYIRWPIASVFIQNRKTGSGGRSLSEVYMHRKCEQVVTLSKNGNSQVFVGKWAFESSCAMQGLRRRLVLHQRRWRIMPRNPTERNETTHMTTKGHNLKRFTRYAITAPRARKRSWRPDGCDEYWSEVVIWNCARSAVSFLLPLPS